MVVVTVFTRGHCSMANDVMPTSIHGRGHGDKYLVSTRFSLSSKAYIIFALIFDSFGSSNYKLIPYSNVEKQCVNALLFN